MHLCELFRSHSGIHIFAMLMMLMMVPLGLEEGEIFLIHLCGVMWECICNADAGADNGVRGVGGRLSFDPFVSSPVGIYICNADAAPGVGGSRSFVFICLESCGNRFVMLLMLLMIVSSGLEEA